MRGGFLRGDRAPRLVSPDPLNVSPALIGQALASPSRRAMAMGVDLLVVALLSGVGNLWLAGGLLLVAVQLGSERAAAQSRRRVAAGWLLVGLFAVLAAADAGRGWVTSGDRPSAKAARAAEPVDDPINEDEVNEAVRILNDQGLSSAASAVQREVKRARARAGVGASSGAASSASAPVVSPAQRIAQLEAELAQLRKPQPLSVSRELRRLLDAVGASFGWGIVYFSLLPSLWNGQTLGKRLLQLRVVELTGRPMTVMRCLRRYGGYAAGMATGGLGFVQALWDVNAQGIQDRTAHTVVIDLRAELVPAVAPPPAA